MAEDGLIFRSLAKISPTYRTPVRGTLVSGVITGNFFFLTISLESQ